ncbi:uncharacterized protein LOC141655518 [Silene latifolia]|uniref:uncharacterized protein LOC141655518 n=1 Tax=Silene latifolia TaxID=37657 RepID=UPI003D786F4C
MIPPATPCTSTIPLDAFSYPVSWALPPLGWLKANMDAALSPSSCLASSGCVIRDCHGSWVLGWSTRFPGTCPFLCEVRAIRDGILRASVLGDNVLVASDCLDAVSAILRPIDPCGPFANIILECRALLQDSPHLKLVFEKRTTNRVADALAHYSVHDVSPAQGCFEWAFAPPFVVDLCTTDFVLACAPLSPDPPP